MSHRSLALILAALALVGAAPSAARAAYRYDYTGPNFTNVADIWTTSDRVTGYVEFLTAPTPGGTFGLADLADFAFTAGIVTVTPANLNPANSVVSFQFGASGDPLPIADWELRLWRPDNATIYSGKIFGGSYLDAAAGPSSDGFIDTFPAFVFARGTWVAAPVPEPASIVLAGFGLAGLAAGRWRRRRRSAR